MDEVIEILIKALTSPNNIGTIFWALVAISSVVLTTGAFGRMARGDDDGGSTLTFKHIRDALDAKRGGPPKKTFGHRLGKTPPIKKRFASPPPTKTNE